MGLVTAEGTRATRTMEELTAASGPARNALEAMIRGRLLVVREVYGLTQFELAHDALVSQWPVLAEWLQTDAEQERARLRLRAAAQEWQRLDRAPEILLRGRALRDALAVPPAPQGTLVDQFVRVSRRHRLRRTVGVAAVAILVPVSVIGVGALVRMRSRAEVQAAADRARDEASALSTNATAKAGLATDERREAFAFFAKPSIEGKRSGEQLWSRLLAREREADAEFARAEQLLESAVLTDPENPSLRADLTNLLLNRLEFADRVGDRTRGTEALERLRVLAPDAPRLKARTAPGTLRVSVLPADTGFRLERYVERDGLLIPELSREAIGGVDAELEAGSYRLVLRNVGDHQVVQPFLIHPGELVKLSLRVPTEPTPAGYVLISEGTFLWGAGDSEVLRAVQGAAPIQSLRLPEYLIARDEVTFAEWTEFLDSLSPAERERRRPMIRSSKGGLQLEKIQGTWGLTMSPTSYVHQALWGQPFKYDGRQSNAVQDWRRMPVSGVGPVDAVRYAEWLAQTGRVPGARLCSDLEWEKAARGADGRMYTTGNRIPPNLANVDETYGQQGPAFGPDEVGRHPESDSPYGIHDMQGNALEVVRSFRSPNSFLGKGGSWYYDAPFSGRLSTAEPLEPESRAPYLGIRLCSSSAQNGGLK